MDNIREDIELDLAETLEDEFILPVVLVDPINGKTYDKNFHDAALPLADQRDLGGQIIYDTRVENPDTGGEIIVHKPVVTLRRTSLERVPAEGEKWYVKIPISPVAGAPIVDFLLEDPGEDGGAIGFIRLYLKKVEQS